MYWWGKVESTDLVHYQQITPYAMTGTDDKGVYRGDVYKRQDRDNP